MNRREFVARSIVLLALPVIAEAQRPTRVVRIGYLSPLSGAADSTNREAFRRGLRELGYVEGQNAAIEARYADGDYDRLPALATELVKLSVDVIVAAPTPAIRAAYRASRTIPIVMAFSGDPIGEGFVAGLARPAGNVTGLSATVAGMAAKRVELLKTIVPHMSRVAYLSSTVTAKQALSETQTAGRTLGVEVKSVMLRNPRDLGHALSILQNSHVEGVIVSLTIQDLWGQVVAFALKSQLPTVSGPREFVEAGGLMAYGPYYADLFFRAAAYVDKILKGAKPGDLPVEQPTKFELIVNAKTAKALGLTIPPSLLVRADHVIE
jgi:putative tryptophan/tyrosine transport system substrate-binding protein